MPKTYGYIRVSSKDQNEDRQLKALRDAGVLEQNMYADKQSGKDFERPRYKHLLRRLRPGDLLYVLSIDRLGRNYEEIQNQWRFLKFGRPKKSTPSNFAQLVDNWEKKRLPLTEVIKICDMSEATFYRNLRELRARKKG